MKVGRNIYTRAPAHALVTISYFFRTLSQQRNEFLSEMRINLWLTFFHGACCHGFTVGALKFIEIRPHFNLIYNAFLQTRESYVPLWGNLQVLYLPRPWGGQPWSLPVQNTVALDKLGWILHLKREEKEKERDTLHCNCAEGVIKTAMTQHPLI